MKSLVVTALSLALLTITSADRTKRGTLAAYGPGNAILEEAQVGYAGPAPIAAIPGPFPVAEASYVAGPAPIAAAAFPATVTNVRIFYPPIDLTPRLLRKHVTIHRTIKVPVAQPIPVPIPQDVPYPVPKLIPVLIDRPYKVPVGVPQPVPVETQVPIPYERPVAVPVPQPFGVPVGVPKPVLVGEPAPYAVPNIVTKAIVHSAPGVVLH